MDLTNILTKVKQAAPYAIPLGAILGGLFIGIRSYKRATEAEEEEEEELKSSGISSDKLKENIKDPNEDDFGKMLFISSYHNEFFEKSIFDVDYLDPQKYNDVYKDEELNNKSRNYQSTEGILHINQITSRGKRFIVFGFDVPFYFENSKQYSYNYPKFSAFKEALCNLRKNLGENVIRITNLARELNCRGMVFYRINKNSDDDGDYEYKCSIIPPSVYCKEGEKDWDKLVEFIRLEQQNLFDVRGGDENSNERYLPQWFLQAFNLKEENVYSIEEFEVRFNLVYPIRSNRPGEEIGLDLITATKCLRYITNEFSVIRGEKTRNNIEYCYRHVIFHPIDKNSGNSIDEKCYCFEENEDGKEKLKRFQLYY